MRWITFAAAIVICALVFKNTDLAHFTQALSGARWQWVVGAALLNLIVNSTARTFRFEALLKRVQSQARRPSFLELSGVLLATRAFNTVLPAKTGETYRTYQLTQYFKFPLEGVLATLLVEPLVEALSLAIPAVAVLVFVPPPHLLARPLYVIAGVGGAGVVLFSLLAWLRSRDPERAPPPARLWGRIVMALKLLNSRRVWLRALAWSWVSDLVDMATIAMCLAAVGEGSSRGLGPIEWFIVLVAVNVAIAIPATPGAVGVLEAGAVLALSALGLGREEALVFAIFYHCVHVIPIAAVGAAFLHFSVRARRRSDSRSHVNMLR